MYIRARGYVLRLLGCFVPRPLAVSLQICLEHIYYGLHSGSL